MTSFGNHYDIRRIHIAIYISSLNLLVLIVFLLRKKKQSNTKKSEWINK